MSKHAAATVSEADETLTTYADAVKRGDYDTHVGNLTGKHDNVRSYWEDQLTRLTLRPFVKQLVERTGEEARKVRIVDLGCGAGQGYELLTKIDQRDLDLGLTNQRVMTVDEIDCYLGVDLSESMVTHGNELYGSNPVMHFVQGDLNEGLAAVAEEKPFDLYFCAYGSMSHLETAALQNLLTETLDHAANGSVIVMDLLGRNSLEWPAYWSASSDAEKYRTYSMSYLHRNHRNELTPGVDIEEFPMRYWTGDEVDGLIDSINAASPQRARGNRLQIAKKFDRSIFVGRHIDTGEYNERLQPMRRAVNRLHEDYMRTDLDELFWQPTDLANHPDVRVNEFFEELIFCWNTLVDFAARRLQNRVSLAALSDWERYPAPLQFALMTIDRVINSTEWIWDGDPRANMIEPQLGYALRSLEYKLQQGLGCGHGLLVVLEVQKS